jgi:hypothetical protein
MPFPVYIVGGGAGSGKDTVAEMMIKGRNGVMIAQADPMKRFARAGLGFSVDQLWGPSSSRNAPDERFRDPKAFAEAREKIFYTPLGRQWLIEIGAPAALRHLEAWFNALEAKYTMLGENVLTPRATLQLLGTEFGRAVSPDIWSEYAIRHAQLLLRGNVSYTREDGIRPDPANPGHRFVVITDGRFRNEFLNVKSLGGLTIQVFNPADDIDSAKVEAAGVKGHASEAELRGVPREWYDAVIRNDKLYGLPALRESVNEMMANLGVGQLNLSTFVYRNAQINLDPRSQW